MASKKIKQVQTIRQKLRLLNTYERRLASGEKSETIINGLAKRAGVSHRTFERYVKQAREWRQILPKVSKLLRIWMSQMEEGVPSPNQVLEKLVKGSVDSLMEPWARDAVYCDELIECLDRLRQESIGPVACQVEQEPLFRKLHRQLPSKMRSDYKQWGKSAFHYATTCRDTFREISDEAKSILEKQGCSPVTEIAFAKTVFENTIFPSFYGYAIQPIGSLYRLKFGKDIIAQAGSVDQLERCRIIHNGMRQNYRGKFNPTELYKRLEESELSILAQLQTALDTYLTTHERTG